MSRPMHCVWWRPSHRLNGLPQEISTQAPNTQLRPDRIAAPFPVRYYPTWPWKRGPQTSLSRARFLQTNRAWTGPVPSIPSRGCNLATPAERSRDDPPSQQSLDPPGELLSAVHPLLRAILLFPLGRIRGCPQGACGHQSRNSLPQKRK